MARKQNNGRKNSTQSWGTSNVEFASRRLSSEEAKAFVEWYKSAAPPFEDAICKVIGETYKVAFKIDMNNSAQVVAFTMQDDRHAHYNVYLTSRSDDPIEAFFMNCYKIWFIYADSKIDTDATIDQLWG